MNAPAGLLYPGDAGFPPGNTGLYKQWWNVSPRLGVAWDVSGNGRTAVRSSYAINYDFPGSAAAQSAANVPPFGGRRQFDREHPVRRPLSKRAGRVNPAECPARLRAMRRFRSRPVTPPSIRTSTRFASSRGTSPSSGRSAPRGRCPASYLGSYIDRIWGPDPINPGVYLGLGPCTLQGVSFPVCSTTANLASRRALTLENPQDGQYLASVFNYEAIGTQRYRGLKLSFQRRAGTRRQPQRELHGVALRDRQHRTTGDSSRASSGNKPGDTSYDLGNCPNNRRADRQLHGGRPGAAVCQRGAARRGLGLARVRHSQRADGQLADRDHRRGISSSPASRGQRVNQVLDNPYGAKTLTNYLNPAAFAYPASGAMGTHAARGV